MGRRAFTLTEVMFCILLAVLGVLAFLSVVSYSLRARNKTSQRHEASVMATSFLNQAELDNWKDFSQSSARPRQPVPGHPGFEYAVTDQTEMPDLKRVDVLIYWQDKQGLQEYRLWTKFVRED